MARQNANNIGIVTQATGKMSRAGTADGLVGVKMIAAIQADFTLSASNATQNAFPTSCDVWTLEADTTYSFKGRYIINTGSTTHTTAMQFTLGGGATVVATGGCEYTTTLWSAGANAIATTQSTKHNSGVGTQVLNSTSNAVYTIIEFDGIIRVSSGGTLTPQITFSANPTGTNLMKVGSKIEFEPWGPSTFEKIGSVA